MPLFQVSVLNKYLAEQDLNLIKERYDAFKRYFLNTTIQNNILSSKEEEFQEGFLREMFVNILGYTINPDEGFNLRTELKNLKDSKKADGAIVDNAKVLGVIELKGTDTTSLGKIEVQAFGYKNNQTDCRYVITSNFQRIRFYIDNAVEFLEWDLFNLDFETFKLLYLCLTKENIFNNLPAKIKEESLVVEEMVTKKLYKEYSNFRKSLFTDISKNNPEIDKLLIFKKTQKLLDRFLFLFFAEDRMLVPPNSVRIILNQWTELKENFDEYQPLYDRFKKYFGYLNTGYKGKLHDIFAYNGGLFAPDEILDSIKIDDVLLFDGTLSLSSYNYNSEVDVNILGHIFEHSLTEIEDLEKEITAIPDEINKSNKRKKDGVFYTPKYITKYIVENTVGVLCKNKKIELGLIEEEYVRGRRNIKTQKPLLDKLYQYKEWLLAITIVDPACGSGAFLNQALEFLIYEHSSIAYLEAVLTKRTHADESVRLLEYNVESHILENNLYGVDINEESIDIAKLSLWLRTARKGRKLNSLSNNIKCGNSLIDDVSVAGEKAFNWQLEFPHIFEKGGFDVVLGNPPYVPTEFISEKDKVFLEKNFRSAYGRINLYPIFYEQGLFILKKDGLLGYITPYTLLKNQYYVEARKYIITNSSIIQLIDFKGVPVFKDAAVDSIILILKRDNSRRYLFSQITNIKSFENLVYRESFHNIEDVILREDYSLSLSLHDKIFDRITKNSTPLKNIVDFNQGIITGGNSKFVSLLKTENGKKLLTGSDFNRFVLEYSGLYIEYDTKKLHRPRKKEIFEAPLKILVRQTGSYPICMKDDQQYYTLDTVHNGIIIDKEYSVDFILGILNSSLMRFLYESQINEGGKVFAQVKIIYLNPLPIPQIDLIQQKPLIEQVHKILELNQTFRKVCKDFTNFLRAKFPLITINNKLQKWFGLCFVDLVIELKKQGVKMSLQQENEWLHFFDQAVKRALEIQDEIVSIDKLIDTIVNNLYGLSEHEVSTMFQAN